MRISLMLRVALGLLGLLQPRVAARLYGADPGAPAVRTTARVLGGRHLVQAAALVLRPARSTEAVSAAVDLLHGASMVALAVARPRLRRPAGTSACVAAVLAVEGLRRPV